MSNIPDIHAPQPVEVIAPPKELKLDLACGQNCVEGHEGVDYVALPGVKHVVNLWKFPWPFDTSSVDAIQSHHHVEHLPMVYVGKDKDGNFTVHKAVPDSPEDKDLFFAFFDECHRILKPEGRMLVTCPAARHNRAFQDPTHRRFLVQESFLYLNRKWREKAGVSHYTVDCHFEVQVESVMSTEEQQWHPEVRSKRFNSYWNVVMDWRAHLVAVKGEKKPLPKSMTERYEGLTFENHLSH